MVNSFGSYSEPGTRNSYEAETFPMVRDDDDVTPELRRRRGEGVRSHSVAQRGAVPNRAAAGNRADAEIGTRANAEAVETTEYLVEAASNKAVRGVSSEGAKRATELVSESPESPDVEGVVSPAGVLELNAVIRQKSEFVFSGNFARFGLWNRDHSEN